MAEIPKFYELRSYKYHWFGSEESVRGCRGLCFTGMGPILQAAVFGVLSIDSTFVRELANLELSRNAPFPHKRHVLRLFDAGASLSCRRVGIITNLLRLGVFTYLLSGGFRIDIDVACVD